MAPRHGRRPLLVPACESFADPHRRKRATTALAAAMAELESATAIIVTRNERERIQAGGAAIDVVLAWRFCSTRTQPPAELTTDGRDES